MHAVAYKSQYTPYERFLGVLNSSETKRTYTKNLKYFLRFCQLDNYSDLIEKLETESGKHDMISDYLMYLKNEKKLSSSAVNIAFSTIKRFYSINRVKLDWDYLTHYKGKNLGKVVEDRLYTKEEIDQLLLHADVREKVVIYTLLSTGMRIGGLAGIRLKDMEWIEEYKLYKFKVYTEEIQERYITYCTPECSHVILKYLEYREKHGDTLKPTSPLIYRKQMRYDNKDRKMIIENQFDIPMDSQSVQQILTRLQRKSAVLPKQKEDDNPLRRGRLRNPVMRCHAFRKMFNTICIKNNMNHYVKEMLMGHKKKLELDYNYFRPLESQLFDEYLKVIDDLTINDEYRLSKQVQELKEKNEDSEYVIKGKLQEKEEQIKVLMSQVEKLNKETNRNRQEFIDIEKQIQEIKNNTKIDPDTRKRIKTGEIGKDEMFEIWVQDRERKKQQQQELDQHLQQYNTQKQ